MLETAALPPILTGLLLGLLFSRFRVRQLALLAYHISFRFWRSYDELYDAAETRFTYEMVNDSPSKKHVNFLSNYHKFQPHAQSRFKSLWNTFAWQVGRDYGFVLLVSFVLFRGNYMAFVTAFTLVQATYFAYLHFYKQYRLDFFAILMIGMMLPKQH